MKISGNAGAQPQPVINGSIDGVTPVLEPLVDKKLAAIGPDTSNEKLEPEVESAQELEAGQKLYLPLVLTLAGAAFLNASLWRC